MAEARDHAAPRQVDEVRRVFDERAADYDTSVMHRDLADAVAAFATERPDGPPLDGLTVLDVGTGTGLVLRSLSARVPSAGLIGADISPGMLAIARDVLPDADWIEADTAALPLADDTIDLITCVTVLHLISDVGAAVSEWSRVLRPGGRLITATFLRGARRPVPTVQRLFPVDHDAFDSLESLATTFDRFNLAPTRHTVWADDIDAVLIAELVGSG